MEINNLEGLTRYLLKRTVAHSPLSNHLKKLVLETDPVPDYYARGNFPPNKRDRNMHLYIPVKNNLADFCEKVLLMGRILNKKYDYNFHINPSQMVFNNQQCSCLRIRNEDITKLKIIIDEFSKQNFAFFDNKKVEMYESSIFYMHYTQFKRLDEDIYQDIDTEFKYFFAVNEHIGLDELLKRIQVIKNNCDFHLFDAFSAYLFGKYKIQDFVGIYSENCDSTRFPEFKVQLNKSFSL